MIFQCTRRHKFTWAPHVLVDGGTSWVISREHGVKFLVIPQHVITVVAAHHRLINRRVCRTNVMAIANDLLVFLAHRSD